MAISHISKVAVNPYRGSEIPDAEAMGLDPDRVYQLFRAPEELARSVPTWNRIQVVIKHTPVSADDPNHDVVVGTLGDQAAFNAPYLDNSLSIWDGNAIAAIESGRQRELSGGYHYRADMRPGIYMGQRYDGVMRDIIGNHVALVESGRAGADVMVMDEAMKEIAIEGSASMPKQVAPLSPRDYLAMGAIHVYLQSKMAKDQALPDLSRMVVGAASTQDIVDRIQRNVQGRLAHDASLEDLSAVLDALKPSAGEMVPMAAAPAAVAPAVGATAAGPEMLPPDATADPRDPLLGSVDPERTNPDDPAKDNDIEEQVRQLLEGKLDDADLEMLLKLIRPEETSENPPAPIDNSDDPPPDKADSPLPPDDKDPARDSDLPRPGGTMGQAHDNKEIKVNKQAMDAAILAAVTEVKRNQKVAADQSVARAIEETKRQINARVDAERFVRPWIGEIQMAMDNDVDVLRLALDTVGVSTKGIPPSAAAFKAMLGLVPKPGDAVARPIRMAADEASHASLMDRFPALKNARVAG